jgi:hypothetical protein
VDEAKVAVGGFIVSGCEAAGIFKLVEAAFDPVAQSVDCGIDGKLDQSVPLGWNHRDTAALFHIFTNEVSVIAFVGEEDLGLWPVGIHDRQIAFVIGDFAACQRTRYGQAHRIDAEMDFGRKATF